ncbi:MAG: Hsp20/alpha crystallin family protein [Deltaproteobacteria bacterium]|jgi:HSP20 family molecular chaperone IbpA|nr:Hsp20/alpha crystallin family protein [Deltaproteobacteria bacterium]
MADSDDKTINVQDKTHVDTGGAESMSGGPLFYPPMDIWEDDAGIHIEAEMPGVEVSGLSVDLKENTLTILGKVPPLKEAGKHLKEEFEIGDYYRQFTVSEVIDQEGITAKIKDGVLALFLPKQAPAQPRKIQVASE